MMIIRAGYNIAFDCPSRTSMILHMNVHPSRQGDLLSPDIVQTDPGIATSGYFDTFGNLVTRIDAPPGRIRLFNDFRIRDSGLPDPEPPQTPLVPVSRLPDDVLIFLLASRYCDVDSLSGFAWANFNNLPTTTATVQAICTFVHGHIRFDYMRANATRTASEGLRDREGVCRDFAHMAVALCRCMNIPARYCTGYLGDIGVPPDGQPMDFSAWFEAYVDGRWFTFDARHNRPRIGRVVMARGRDAADVAISTAFGIATLAMFDVTTYEEVQAA